MDQECGDHICEERECEPLECVEYDPIAGKELQPHDEGGRRHHQPDRSYRPPRQQRATRRDRAEVGADVDSVRNHHRKDAEADQPGRELAAKAESEPDTRVQRNSRAELLHRNHERESEQRRPEDAEAKRDPALRKAPMPTGPSYRPGDEAWPQDLQEALGAHPPGGANARLRGGRTAGGRHIIGLRRRFEELVFRRLDIRAELHALESRVVDIALGSQRAYFPG